MQLVRSLAAERGQASSARCPRAPDTPCPACRYTGVFEPRTCQLHFWQGGSAVCYHVAHASGALDTVFLGPDLHEGHALQLALSPGSCAATVTAVGAGAPRDPERAERVFCRAAQLLPAAAYLRAAFGRLRALLQRPRPSILQLPWTPAVKIARSACARASASVVKRSFARAFRYVAASYVYGAAADYALVGIAIVFAPGVEPEDAEAQPVPVDAVRERCGDSGFELFRPHFPDPLEALRCSRAAKRQSQGSALAPA